VAHPASSYGVSPDCDDDLFGVLLDDASASPASDAFDLVAASSPKPRTNLRNARLAQRPRSQTGDGDATAKYFEAFSLARHLCREVEGSRDCRTHLAKRLDDAVDRCILGDLEGPPTVPTLFS